MASEQNNILPLKNQVIPPTGWFTDDELNNTSVAAYTNATDFVTMVNATLPQATSRSEDLIEALYKQLEIEVSTAYLTIDADAAYHVFLLVSHDDYRSPHMQAAHLLLEKFTGNTLALSIRFTFTVGREHIMSYLSTNQYKLKHVRSVEKQQLALE